MGRDASQWDMLQGSDSWCLERTRLGILSRKCMRRVLEVVAFLGAVVDIVVLSVRGS